MEKISKDFNHCDGLLMIEVLIRLKFVECQSVVAFTA